MPKNQQTFSKRERQIMDIIYEKKNATAQEVRENMTDAPSYTAVRTLLSILVQKKHLDYFKEGKKYVYTPLVSREDAGVNALSHLLDVFFESSLSKAVLGLLGEQDKNVNNNELDKLQDLINKAREAE